MKEEEWEALPYDNKMDLIQHRVKDLEKEFKKLGNLTVGIPVNDSEARLESFRSSENSPNEKAHAIDIFDVSVP